MGKALEKGMRENGKGFRGEGEGEKALEKKERRENGKGFRGEGEEGEWERL